MADQQLNIKLNVIDNASKAFSQVRSSIFNVKNALIGLGAGVAFKSLVDIGKQTNSVRIRLDELAKAGYGGGQAFDQLRNFAIKAKIPLLDVLQASNDLLSVSKSPEELARNLEIASNASARFGISFTDSADQLAKAFLKGIDSARLFNDRGIRSIDGFGKFADTSIGNLPALFEKVFGATGAFGKANENLKKGLNGTLISLDNIFKELQITIAQGFFDTLTRELGQLELFFLNNRDAINKFGREIGEVLAVAILKLSDAIVFVKDNFQVVLNFFIAFIALKVVIFITEVITAFKQLGLAILALDAITKKSPIILFLSTLAGVVSGIYLTNKALEETKEIIKELNQVPLDFMDGLTKTSEQAKKSAIDVGKVFEGIQTTNQTKLKELNDQYRTTEGITKIITDGLNEGIKSFSQGIAESIVLGKQLSDTFRSIAQSFLVSILRQALELIARETLSLILEKAKTTQLFAQLTLEKQITAEKIKQASVSSGGGGGGGFLSTIARIGFNLIAGGGSVPLDAPNFYSPAMEAEGGAVRGGMPITVGERGRELFVPSTSGTIVPNHDMANTGTNITFNIQANDVRGIKELLIDNRATIINLVNQGANQKGKSNVV
jgi:hypothetical protein